MTKAAGVVWDDAARRQHARRKPAGVRLEPEDWRASTVTNAGATVDASEFATPVHLRLPGLIRRCEDLYSLLAVRVEREILPGESIGRSRLTMALLVNTSDPRPLLYVVPSGNDVLLPTAMLNDGVDVVAQALMLAKRYLRAIDVDDVTPVGRIEYHVVADGASSLAEHRLVVAVHLASLPLNVAEGAFVPLEAVASVLPSAIDRLVSELVPHLAARTAAGPVDHEDVEITAARPVRRWIHRNVVRPLVAPLSSQRLRRKVLGYAQGAESVVDVSVGDDRLILELARHAELAVASDISCSLLVESPAARGRRANVVLACHDALRLPFQRRFDFALCKNSLHHLQEVGQLALLSRSLERTARRILFVDIVDLGASRKARAWNFYYRRMLGDQGRSFLTFEQFRCRLTAAFPGATFDFETVETLKGTYAFGLVSTSNDQRRTA